MKKGLFLIFMILFSISCKDEINIITSKQPGKIVGTVLPKDSIAIINLYQGEIIATAKTVNGIFQFEEVPPGIYRISIKADNLGKQEIQNIKVEDGEGNDIGIILLSKYPYPLNSTSPFNGEENVLAYSRNIRFEFSEDIDPSSLERGFKIEPNTEMENYSNSSNRYFYFYPVLNFETEYKVTLDTSVTTTFGEHLEFPAILTFKTGDFELNDVSFPFITSSNSSNLSLYFNGVLSDDSEESITIQPKIAIKATQDSRLRYPRNGKTSYSAINFLPTNGWMSNTTFIVNINKNIEEINGAHLKNDTLVSFTTPQLKITKTRPLDGQFFIDTLTSIQVDVNYILDESTIKNAITITPFIDFDLVTNSSYGRTIFLIRPTQPLSKNDKYIVTINKSLTDFYGVHMSEDYSFSFTTKE